MKRYFANQCVVTAVWVAATLCLISTPAAAQYGSAEATSKTHAASAKPTPRTADGHPDFNGLWGFELSDLPVRKTGNVTYVGLGTTPNLKFAPLQGDKVVLNAGAQNASENDPDGVQAGVAERDLSEHDARAAAIKKNPNLQPSYKPELMQKVAYMDLHANEQDPRFTCHFLGVPRIGPPDHIVQTPGQMVFLYGRGSNHAFRIVPTDGRPHRADLDASTMGDSVGHWEGDKLVVDVTNLDDSTWLGSDGWFHSDKLHVIETFRREGDNLIYQQTVEDPEVLAKPWVRAPRTIAFDTDPREAIYEQPPCHEMEQAHMVTHEHH